MPETLYALADILKSTDYALDIFDQKEIDALTLYEKNGKPYLRDFCGNAERPAKPEEIVRQLFLYRLMNTYKYPAGRIAVEKGVYFGSTIAEKRADIVIADKDHPDTAYIIVEVKKPKRKDGLEQLKSYCNAEGAPIAVWTNGGEIAVLHREGANTYRALSDIPRADQTLAELINERVTIEELRRDNKLAHGTLTLKKIITDLEDLVLANAGVDAFEEVFKLIYAKLYDEWRAERRTGHYVEFRAAGETDIELYGKISGLLNDAKDKWRGVFMREERIDLTPAHLKVCVSFLQDIALFNSNLQVIDEAFEYLVTQVAKGAKGQYFTPRYVIDMCVKMLNPKEDEYMIDTAAGSCGFTIHTIFHVWGGELTAKGPDKRQADYAGEMVFGIDFDARSVKIAKAINLIAGDGRTNVFRLNSLEPHAWEDVPQSLRDRLTRFPDSQSDDDENQKTRRYFDFDVLMTNPPFAGDIKDTKTLYSYELAKHWRMLDVETLADPERRDKWRYEESGKWNPAQSRDVLFIERNLQFLRPGGRMAIVLPQGRFNNVSDGSVREYIAKHARILAVVGLHGNTFKPHTGTKTSVLFLQKWNDDRKLGPLCPKVDDYPVFFATSERGGKDNSGDYVFQEDEDGEPLRDSHNHLIVEHDLDEIADAFIAYAERHNLSFVGEGE